MEKTMSLTDEEKLERAIQIIKDLKRALERIRDQCELSYQAAEKIAPRESYAFIKLGSVYAASNGYCLACAETALENFRNATE